MVLGLRLSDPDSEDLEYWDPNVYYDDMKGFASDEVFFTLVYIDSESGEVTSVRCNCDEFELPSKGETVFSENVRCCCKHANKSSFIVQFQLDFELRQSDAPEALPLPDCLKAILD